jgi:TonB family protein
MVPKRSLLVFTSVAVLALLILYIRIYGPESSRPVPQLQKPIFGAPLLDGNAGNSLVRKVRPQYTKAALNAHYEGRVRVNFTLGTDGMAHDIEIVNSPGYGMDQNIIETMKQWLWDSQFIHEDQKVTITIDFKLNH